MDIQFANYRWEIAIQERHAQVSDQRVEGFGRAQVAVAAVHDVIAEVEQCIGSRSLLARDCRGDMGAAKDHLRVPGDESFAFVSGHVIGVNMLVDVGLLIKRADRVMRGHTVEIDRSGTHILVINLPAGAFSSIITFRKFYQLEEILFQVSLELLASELNCTPRIAQYLYRLDSSEV